MQLGYFADTFLTYLLPIVAYYVGIAVRHYARFLRSSAAPPFGQQLVAGIVFSLVAVAPLYPAIKLTVTVAGLDVVAYVLIMVVIMQEGLVLHERAVALVSNLVTQAQDRAGQKAAEPGSGD